MIYLIDYEMSTPYIDVNKEHIEIRNIGKFSGNP